VLGHIIEGEVGAEAGETGDIGDPSAAKDRGRGQFDWRDEEMGESGEIKGSEQNRSGRCPGLSVSRGTCGTCMVFMFMVLRERELMMWRVE
jgi:hypothetical protein